MHIQIKKVSVEKLKAYSQPTSKVIRNGNREEVKSEDLVIGDSVIVEEGTLVAADAVIQQSNDFSVNESILTGESFAVSKDNGLLNNLIYSGTTVVSGLAIATITAVGNNTKLGLIGKSLESISEEKTPLEKQIGSFVKMMAISGAVFFFDCLGFELLALTRFAHEFVAISYFSNEHFTRGDSRRIHDVHGPRSLAFNEDWHCGKADEDGGGFG